jgi:hypothetical protein
MQGKAFLLLILFIMCKPAKYFRILEVEVNNVNSLEFALPLDEVLRDACKITGISAYPVSSMAVSPVTVAAVVNNTVFNKSTLTLQTKDDQDRIVNLPLQAINPAINNGQIFQIDMPALNTTKCRMRVGNSASLVKGEVWAIGFQYEKSEK